MLPDLGQHLRDEPLDAALGGERGEALEQPGADAAPLEGVADGEGDLGGRRVPQARVVRERDDAPLEAADERPVSSQSGSTNGSTSFGPSAGKPWKRR